MKIVGVRGVFDAVKAVQVVPLGHLKVKPMEVPSGAREPHLFIPFSFWALLGAFGCV